MRERHRCPACDVVIPTDAGRCPTCDHEAGDGVVVVGDAVAPSAAPPPDPGSAGGGPRGRRIALLVIAVFVLIVGGLAVVERRVDDEPHRSVAGGESDPLGDPSSTWSRVSTPTDAAATAPNVRSFASAIPLADGVRLLGWLATGWAEVLDPATGTVTPMRIGSGSEYVDVVPRLGGMVVVNQGGIAHWSPQVPLIREPVAIDDNVVEVVPSDHPERVWVVHAGRQTTFEEINLATSESSSSVALPSESEVCGAVDGGLVVSAVDGLYVSGRDGTIRPIAPGQFVAGRGSLVAYRACDDELRCGLYIQDLRNDRSEVVAGTEDLQRIHTGELSPDGRWLAMIDEDSTGPWRVLLVEVPTGQVTTVIDGQSAAGAISDVTWSADSEWLLWPTYPGVVGYRPSAGVTATIDAGGVSYLGLVVLGPPAG